MVPDGYRQTVTDRLMLIRVCKQRDGVCNVSKRSTGMQWCTGSLLGLAPTLRMEGVDVCLKPNEIMAVALIFRH